MKQGLWPISPSLNRSTIKLGGILGHAPRHTSLSDREIAALAGGTVGGDSRAGDLSSPLPLEYDFGSVLSGSQTLRHDFTLSNPSSNPVRPPWGCALNSLLHLGRVVPQGSAPRRFRRSLGCLPDEQPDRLEASALRVGERCRESLEDPGPDGSIVRRMGGGERSSF